MTSALTASAILGASDFVRQLPTTLGIAVLFVGTLAHAGPHETVCPPPSQDVPPGAISAGLTGIPLEPGTAVETEGTNDDESTELGDLVLRTYVEPFGFSTAAGPVTGTVIQRIKRGGDDHCKVEWTIVVNGDAKGCVSGLRIDNFRYPVGVDIVADFRDDIDGDRAPKLASRSPDGTKFRFRLPRVCANQVSRPLLLNTLIDKMARKGSVQLQGPAGELSPPIPTYVPKP
jgi:hypothetical protein